MKRILLAVLLLIAALPALAQSIRPSGAPSGGGGGGGGGGGSCPQGVYNDPDSGVSDGCPGAPASGNFQRSAFFTYAAQSGQTLTRPTKNVAAVDYAIGYSTLATLCDPSSNTNPTGSACNPTGSTPGLPSGATYSDNRVTVASSSADINLKGFSWKKPNGCTVLSVSASYTGNLTVDTADVGYAVVISGTDRCTDFYLWRIDGGASLTLRNAYFDGAFATWNANAIAASKSAIALMEISVGIPLTINYTAFLHIPHAVNYSVTGAPGDFTTRYNYVEDFNPTYASFEATLSNGSGGSGNILNVSVVHAGTIPAGSSVNDNQSLAPVCVIAAYGTGGTTGTGGAGTYQCSVSGNLASRSMYAWNGTHGEPYILLWGTGSPACTSGCTMSHYTQEFETILALPGNGGITANITPYQGSATGTTITTLDVNQNVTVGNKQTGNSGNGAVGPSTVGLQLARATATTANLKRNYLDPTGSFNCFVLAGGGTIGTLNQTGNVNMRDGSSIPDFTVGNCNGHL